MKVSKKVLSEMTKQDENFKKCMDKLDRINKKLDGMSEKIIVGDIFIWILSLVWAVCLLSYFFKWVTS